MSNLERVLRLWLRVVALRRLMAEAEADWPPLPLEKKRKAA